MTKDNIKNLVLDQENVTRDYVEGTVRCDEKSFHLVDTGGFSFQKHKDHLVNQVNKVVTDQIEKSKIVVFVCDAMTGPVEEDLRFLSELRKRCKKKIFLAINKADNPELKNAASSFVSFGFSEEDTFIITATHGKGFKKLCETIFQELPEEECFAPVAPMSAYKVTIVGKPNVGKSSLLNHLIKEERSIVSEIEGTTREAISCKTKIHDSLFELVDTAGVRRKKSVEEGLEGMMVKSSFEAIRTASLIILVVDASEKKLCKQDLRLLSYATENNKNLLLVLNKVDLLDELTTNHLDYQLEIYHFILKKIPMVRVSCLDEKNIAKVRKHINDLKGRSETQFDTQEVTEKIKTYLSHRPLYKKKQILKIFKARFVPSKVPTFHLYVNKPELFGKSELSCIENVLRKAYDLRGCQVRFNTLKV
jgi:GTP-binding protein